MSGALAAAIEGAALGAAQLGIGYLQKKVESGGSVAPTKADVTELGKKLVALGVQTGADLADLHDALEEAGRARQDALFEAAKRAEIGAPDESGT